MCQQELIYYTHGWKKDKHRQRLQRVAGTQQHQQQPSSLTSLPPAPCNPPLSVGNENWAEVFVIKYVRGNSRKWT